MDYYAKQKEVAASVAALLERPLSDESELQSIGDFDPWEIFPSLYGVYSSDFDEAALAVLSALDLSANDNWDAAIELQRKEGLAHHMIREMLCTADLCDYGSSPRVCFSTPDFKPLIGPLIEKWKAYYEMHWGEAYSPASHRSNDDE